MKHILSVLVENKSGVLSRVTGMISRRGFNIESLTVAPTEDSTMSRLTAIVNADEVGYEQITKQLHKLVSVYKITDLTDEDAIERELALFKVSAPPDRRHEIIEIANVFRANIVDVVFYFFSDDQTVTSIILAVMILAAVCILGPYYHWRKQEKENTQE
mgnify:CR=1 FL=1